jgi:nucleoside-diphosphate-sugar epimerase
MTDLRDCRILVTGGAGFIGSATVAQLMDLGCRHILVVDDLTRGRPDNLDFAKKSARVSLTVGDIRDRGLMHSLIDGVDTVFHLAALRITHCAAEPRQAIEVMIDATHDLMEQCVKAKVRKVVMASTASIYGMASVFPTPEEQNAYGNRTLYGAAKSFGEALLRSFNEMYGLNYMALRYFNVYGPRMDIQGKYTEVLIRWMQRIEAGAPPIIFGDGSQTMDMVYVDDVARANVLAASAQASDFALNIGGGSEISLLELAERLAAAMGRPDLRPIHETARAVNSVSRRFADISAATRVIGYRPEVSLDHGLKRLIAWRRAQHDRTRAEVETSQ